MRVHHLNCMSLCPLGGRLIGGSKRWLGRARLVCHCLLLETDRRGLVLVDTGIGCNDIRSRGRLSPVLRALEQPSFDEKETAARQIERLGLRCADVRAIVLTHLDFDHAGGLDDFPEARVHVLARELERATRRRSWLDRQRFRPAQWQSARWTPYPSEGESWFGFESVRAAAGLGEEILFIPLPGYTSGHAGVAVRTRTGWLLHCGDAYFCAEQMNPVRPYCTPGLCAYERLMAQDRTALRRNQGRLRALARERFGNVQLFCAHDPVEFERLRRSAGARSARPTPSYLRVVPRSN